MGGGPVCATGWQSSRALSSCRSVRQSVCPRLRDICDALCAMSAIEPLRNAELSARRATWQLRPRRCKNTTINGAIPLKANSSGRPMLGLPSSVGAAASKVSRNASRSRNGSGAGRAICGAPHRDRRDYSCLPTGTFAECLRPGNDAIDTTLITRFTTALVRLTLKRLLRKYRRPEELLGHNRVNLAQSYSCSSSANSAIPSAPMVPGFGGTSTSRSVWRATAAASASDANGIP